MTTQPRHLMAVPDHLDSIVTGALLGLAEEVAALEIHEGRHLWNVETNDVIAAEHASNETVAEFAAARERHLARVFAGEPLPEHVKRMQAALHRALAREDHDQ